MNHKPKLYGLLLVGGRSTRMGSEKHLLKYGQDSQQKRTYDLLTEVCDSTFLSIRQDQVPSCEKDFKVIVDQNKYKGPFNGILSAHEVHPEVAWLVLACDLPFLDMESIKDLVTHRNPDKSATSLSSKKTNIPEPLITIWEPKGLESAKVYLQSKANSGPKEFLLNSDIAQVYPMSDEVLFNVNSQEDFEQAKNRLSKLQHG